MTDKPTLYRLIDKDGNVVCVASTPLEFPSARKAAQYARDIWPDQEQDEERSGRGWDVEVVKD